MPPDALPKEGLQCALRPDAPHHREHIEALQRSLRATAAAYDQVADEYALRLPDVRAETLPELSMLLQFADLTRGAPAALVAELGCGTGRITAHLRSLGLDVIGMDLSAGMIAKCALTVGSDRLWIGSITQLALRDESLAGVVGWYSTIHLPARALPPVFDELARVLAPGGHLLLAFHVGDETEPRTVTYRNGISLVLHDLQLETACAMAIRAGLLVRTTHQRAPGVGVGERRPRACLLAAKPGADDAH